MTATTLEGYLIALATSINNIRPIEPTLSYLTATYGRSRRLGIDRGLMLCIS
jgi:hypothetical protein